MVKWVWQVDGGCGTWQEGKGRWWRRKEVGDTVGGMGGILRAPVVTYIIAYIEKNHVT